MKSSLAILFNMIAHLSLCYADPSLQSNPKKSELAKIEKETEAADRKILKHVNTIIEKKLTIHEAFRSMIETQKKKPMFDGRARDQTSVNAMRLHCKKKHIEEKINTYGSYLIWHLPSSEIIKERPRGLGIMWSKEQKPEIFFVEVEIASVER